MKTNKNTTHPPRWADKLLEWLCPDKLLEEIQGDLHELFEERLAEVGERQARREYVHYVLGFLRPYTFKRQPSKYPPTTYTDMFQNYLTVAFRNIIRHKTYSLISTLGLALGICACLAIYLITQFEFSFDTFHPDRERIYRIVGKLHTRFGEEWDISNVYAPVPAAVREEMTGLETVAGFHLYGNVRVSIPAVSNQPEKPAKKFEERQTIIIAEPQYFDIFKYSWLAGNAATALQEPFQVVLSVNKARKYFGLIPLDQIIGKTVIYNDSLHVKISGIVKDWDQHTDFGFTDFISFSTAKHSFLQHELMLDSWDQLSHSPVAFVKLSEGINPEQVNAQFPGLISRHVKTDPQSKFSMQLQPLSDIHFNNQYQEYPYRKAHLPTLYGLMGIALFILLIAAINFINLSTAQSLRRTKEIGIRKVLGSQRSSIILQFLTETWILTFFALIISVLLINPVFFTFSSFIPEGITFDPSNPAIFLFLLFITLLTTLLAGFYPAKVLSAYKPVLSLKGNSMQKGGEKWYLRKGLIVFQFTISLVFILCTLVISDQISYIRNKDLGFKTNAILNVRTNWSENSSKVKVLVQQLNQLPGIKQAILEGAPPLGFMRIENIFRYKGKQEIEMPARVKVANEDFIPFYQIPLLAGRNLMAGNSMNEYVINENFAKALGFAKPEEAVGKWLYINQKEAFSIVGVVADFHDNSLHESIWPLVITNRPDMGKNIAIKLASNGKQVSDVNAILANIEKEWKKIYPEAPFDYSFLDESITWFYDKEQKTAMLMQTAILITIFISCMGVFGLVMFTAQQKRKEIGIRKVLGATVTNIALMLTKEFIVLVTMAMLIASPIAWYLMKQWLEDFAYRTQISFWVFIIASIGTILIALLTASFQAIKAARANPVISLRNE